MTTADEARAARDAKLDALHEKLTAAVEQLVSGEDWRQALEFAARFRARSFNNTLLIWTQHQAAFEQGRVPEPMPSHVAGSKQWQTPSSGQQYGSGNHRPRRFARGKPARHRLGRAAARRVAVLRLRRARSRRRGSLRRSNDLVL